MKEKRLFAVVTFFTTEAALAMERAANREGFEGRLIPVPGEIKAGCGMAWKCRNQSVEEAEEFIKKERLSCEAVYQVML